MCVGWCVGCLADKASPLPGHTQAHTRTTASQTINQKQDFSFVWPYPSTHTPQDKTSPLSWRGTRHSLEILTIIATRSQLDRNSIAKRSFAPMLPSAIPARSQLLPARPEVHTCVVRESIESFQDGTVPWAWWLSKCTDQSMSTR